MKLFEIFDKQHDIKKHRKDHYSVNIGDEEYQIIFHEFGSGLVAVNFLHESDNIFNQPKILGNLKDKAQHIFGAVIQATQQYVKDHPFLRAIMFNADSDHPSRIKLYSTIAKRIARQHNVDVYKGEVKSPYNQHMSIAFLVMLNEPEVVLDDLMLKHVTTKPFKKL